MRKSRAPIRSVANTLLASYIAIASFYPPLRAVANNKVNVLVVSLCMLLWLMSSVSIAPKFFVEPTGQRLVTFIFVVYAFLVPYLLGNATIGNRYLGCAPVFFMYVVYEFNAYTSRNSSSWTVVKVSIPFIVIALVKTGLALVDNPYVSRSISASDEYAMSLLARGIGGYDFVYFLACVYIVLLYFAVAGTRSGNGARRILSALGCAAAACVIVLSNYSTALVIVLFAPILLCLIRAMSRRKYATLLLVVLLGILLVFVGRQVLVHLLDSVSSLMEYGPNYARVVALKETLLYGSRLDIFQDRLALLGTSVNAFWRNPILGMVAEPIQIEGGYLQGFGQHSWIIDTFALLGLIPGMMQIYILIQPFSKRLRHGRVCRDFVWAMLFAVLLIAGLDNPTPSLGFAAFFIFPLSVDLCSNASAARTASKDPKRPST